MVHRKRKFGKSKFGINRFVNGYLDLLSLWFLMTFGRKPMHLFGLIGSLLFLIGGIMVICLIVIKVSNQVQGMDFRPVTEQPLFYLSLTSIIIGTQLFLTGFIGEMISRNSEGRNTYNIKERLNMKG